MVSALKEVPGLPDEAVIVDSCDPGSIFVRIAPAIRRGNCR